MCRTQWQLMRLQIFQALCTSLVPALTVLRFLVSRIQLQRIMPTSAESRWRRLSLAMLQFATTTMSQMVKLYLGQKGMKNPCKVIDKTDWTTEQRNCRHPEKNQRKGGNQWGRWTTCGLCLARTSYVAQLSPKAKAKSKSKESKLSHEDPHVQEAIKSAASHAAREAARQIKNEESVSRTEVENLLAMSIEEVVKQLRKLDQSVTALTKENAAQWHVLRSLQSVSAEVPSPAERQQEQRRLADIAENQFAALLSSPESQQSWMEVDATSPPPSGTLL